MSPSSRKFATCRVMLLAARSLVVEQRDQLLLVVAVLSALAVVGDYR
jgi:hypothetical protein